jgi:hypothetical protein
MLSTLVGILLIVAGLGTLIWEVRYSKDSSASMTRARYTVFVVFVVVGIIIGLRYPVAD